MDARLSQKLLFPVAVVQAFGVRPGCHNESARIFKSLVARGTEVPRPALGGCHELGLYSVEIDEIRRMSCRFVNIINSQQPRPKARLDSERCMECGAILDCPRGSGNDGCRSGWKTGWFDVSAETRRQREFRSAGWKFWLCLPKNVAG